MLLSRLRRNATPRESVRETAGSPRPTSYILVGLLGLYFAVQLLVPLRHHLYPGNVSWKDEGHRFSWHMKLRDKQAEGRFVAVDPASGDAEVIRPWEYGLTVEQEYAMLNEPDMILQFAHHVEEELREEGREDVEIRALAAVSLNGRDPQLLIDPAVDLADQRRTLAPVDWILPLDEPLPAGAEKPPWQRVNGPPFIEYQQEIRQGARQAGWGELFQPRARQERQ